MGATVGTISLRNVRTGQVRTISAYWAGGDQANYVAPVATVGAATAGHGKQFTLPPGPWDIVYMDNPATGTWTVDVNGSPTDIQIVQANVIARVADPSKAFGRLTGGPEKLYSIRVITPMAA